MAQLRTVSAAALVQPSTNPNKMRPADEELLRDAVAHLQTEGITSAEVSLLQPVLVREAADGSLHIIDGAHRVAAAVASGIRDVPAVVIACTEEQAKLLQVGMNKLRGALDYRETAEALQNILDAPDGVDAILAGHSSSALADLLSLEMRTDIDLDLSDEPGPAMDRPTADPAARPFALPEIAFATRTERDKALRGLKKAAGGGRSPDISAGLLRLVEG